VGGKGQHIPRDTYEIQVKAERGAAAPNGVQGGKCRKKTGRTNGPTAVPGEVGRGTKSEWK